MNSGIRSLGLGEILDQTALHYRCNFFLFAGVALIPTAIMFGIGMIIGVAAGFSLSAAALLHQPNMGLYFLLMALAIPFLVVPAVFSQAGVTRAAVSAYRGTKLKVREALAGVKPRFWRYLGLMILQCLVIGGIPVACAGVVIGTAFLFAAGSGAGSAAAIASGLLAVCVFIAAVVVFLFAGNLAVQQRHFL